MVFGYFHNRFKNLLLALSYEYLFEDSRDETQKEIEF